MKDFSGLPITAINIDAISAKPTHNNIWHYVRVSSLSFYSLFSGMLSATLAAKGSVNNKSYDQLDSAGRAWAGFNFLASLILNFFSAYFFAKGVFQKVKDLRSANGIERFEFFLAALVTVIAGVSEVGLGVDAYSLKSGFAYFMIALGVMNILCSNVFANQGSIANLHRDVCDWILWFKNPRYRQLNHDVFKPLNRLENRYRVSATVDENATLRAKCDAIFEKLNEALEEKNIDLDKRSFGETVANKIYDVSTMLLFLASWPVLILMLNLGQQGFEELFGSFENQQSLTVLSWVSAISNALVFMYCASLLLGVVLELGARILAKQPSHAGRVAGAFCAAALVMALSVFSGESMAGVASSLQQPNNQTGADNSYLSIAQAAIDWLGDHVWFELKPFFYSSIGFPILVRTVTAALNTYSSYDLIMDLWSPTSRKPGGELEVFPADLACDLRVEVHKSGVDGVYGMFYSEPEKPAQARSESEPLLGDGAKRTPLSFWHPEGPAQVQESIWCQSFFGACISPAPDSCASSVGRYLCRSQ